MEGIEGIERKNSIDIRQAKVLYSYLQNEEDELSVNLGDIVTILDMSDNDWWQCECNGEIGLLPSNYLQIISEGSHIGEKEAEHDNIPHEISSPKPYPISQSDLPPGWKMFVDKESGDIYYHNEDTGETTWDPPEKAVAPLISSATQDLRDLNYMKQQANSKINLLKNALEAVPVVTPNKSAQKLPKVSSANHQKSNKHIGDMSIEEINEIIDQRVLKEVKKREEDILQKVQTMLSSQPSKLRSSSDSASPTKQRKTEPSQFNPTKLPMISRSADSKYKTPHQTDEDAFRPKSGPEGILIPNNPSPIRNLEFHPKKLKLTSLKSPTTVKQRNSDSDWNSPFSQPVSNDAQDDSSIGKNSVTDNESAIGTLSLSYVHGYDGDFTRNGGTKASGKNVFWLSEEIIIYPAATLVILLNTQSGKQHYYRSHTEEVSALTIHNTLHLVASGQMGKDSRILIWDPRPILQNGPNGSPKGRQKFSPRDPPIDPSLQYHREIFLGAKTRGAMGLNFSPDGVLLVALGLEETKPIFIYDWSKNECLASVKLGHIDLYQIGFNPYLYVPPAKSHVSDVSASGDEGDVNSTRINPTKVPLEDNICCYSLISTMTRGVKFWTLRSIKERNDVVALASNGSQFKGRKIAIPKNKQSWSWKYVLEGNIGVFPKKSNHTPPDMTCYSILPEESEPGKLPKSKILTGGSNGSVYIWQQLEAGVEDTSREDYVPQFWFPRGRLLCVITGVHEGSLLDIDTYLTPSSINQQIKYLVATCGKDGVLNLWELDGKPATSDVLPMEHVTAINVSSHSTIIGSPRSAQWCFDGHHLIVGTTGNSLCLVRNHGPSTTASPAATHSLTDQQSSTQFNDLRLDIVISGHVGRINRVVPHPLHELYATVGVDKSVRLWSTKWSKQVAFTRVASNPTCAAFLPDGSGIAVGTEVGEVLILTCTYLQKLLENGEESKPNRKRVKWELLGKKFIGSKSKGKDGNVQAPTGGGGAGGPKQKNQIQSFEITEIKYSPDGEILAVATRDKFIHFLSAKNGYKKIAICKGHSGVISRIDWTNDSTYLQSTDGTRESLLWEVSTGKQWSGNSKDFIWSSWTNPIGSYVRGILNGPNGIIEHSSNNANSNGNNNHNSNNNNNHQVTPSANDLSTINGVYRSNDQHSLVVAGGGNSFTSTSLKLFRFPCEKNSKSKEYSGHSSSIKDVCYLVNDIDICSVGGSDSCIFCWKHHTP